MRRWSKVVANNLDSLSESGYWLLELAWIRLFSPRWNSTGPHKREDPRDPSRHVDFLAFYCALHVKLVNFRSTTPVSWPWSNLQLSFLHYLLYDDGTVMESSNALDSRLSLLGSIELTSCTIWRHWGFTSPYFSSATSYWGCCKERTRQTVAQASKAAYDREREKDFEGFLSRKRTEKAAWALAWKFWFVLETQFILTRYQNYQNFCCQWIVGVKVRGDVSEETCLEGLRFNDQ